MPVDVPLLLERLGIQAKRKGREWWACCPLPGHDERTPSWQMRDDPDDPAKHGRWRCLGACHVGGGPAGLVLQLLQLDRAREAWDWIRSNAHVREEERALSIELSPPAGAAARRRGFQLPAGVQLRPLDEWPSPARWYVESRGITEEQVDRWGIGYAVDGRLSGRIVLPWRDGRGHLVGYTARAFTPTGKRYLEPRGEEGADRSAIYGEEHWPAPDARACVFVTEGALDALAVERAVREPVAALCGSVLLPGHVARLSTFAEVVVASDPDGAGDGLVDAAVSALVRWVRVRRAVLPAGYDCARLAKERGETELAIALGC
jgi:DNA primase